MHPVSLGFPSALRVQSWGSRSLTGLGLHICQKVPHSSVSLQQDCFLCLNFVSPGAMEGLCEIALPILTVWPRAWIHSSTMGHVFSLQTATSYPLLFVCLFPGKSAGLISGPVQGKHITSLAVLTTLSLPALVRIQQAVSWGLGRGSQDGSDRLGSFLGAEQEHDSKEIRFPRLSVLLWRCGNPLVCESPTGSFPSVFSLYQACRASKRRTHRPSGMAVLHHVESKRQMKRKKSERYPCGHMQWAG